MKKFNIVIVGTLALCAALVFGFAACSNAGGDVSPIVGVGGTQTGDGTTVVNPGDNGGSSGGTGGGAVSGNEKILDLRIKKNGVLYTGAGSSASVTASVSKSLSAANGISFSQDGESEQVPGDGWDEKLWTQDRHQTSHVKVENAIVDNVPGLKFTITRPTSKYFDPYYKISKESEWYEWVGDNNGNYEHKGWKYVGAGKGDHVLQGATYEWLGDKKGDYDNYRHEEVGAGKGAFIKVCDNYTLLTTNTGDYVETGFEFVGEGNGTFEKCQSSPNWHFYEYVGAGNGNIDYDLTYDGPRRHYKNVGEGQGSYKLVEGYDCEYVGWDFDNDKGNGSYLRKVIRVDRSSGEWVSWIYDPLCKWVEFGNGDWNEKADYVGQGNGDYIKKEHCKWVGDGNGDYVETFEEVGENQGAYVKHENWIYGGWDNVGIIRLEDLGGNGDITRTTQTWLSIGEWDKDEKVNTCFYPMCEPGERYVFIIELQSTTHQLHSGDPDYIKKEYLSIVAQDGIGDIDYSNLDPSRNIEVKYDGEKPIAKLKNCIPPENMRNIVSVLHLFAGNRDWQGDSTQWIARYDKTDDIMQFDKDPCMEYIRRNWTTYDENGNERPFTDEELEDMRPTHCFNAALKAKGKKEFYAAHCFTFTVPEAKGIQEFTSIYIESEVVPIK